MPNRLQQWIFEVCCSNVLRRVLTSYLPRELGWLLQKRPDDFVNISGTFSIQGVDFAVLDTDLAENSDLTHAAYKILSLSRQQVLHWVRIVNKARRNASNSTLSLQGKCRNLCTLLGLTEYYRTFSQGAQWSQILERWQNLVDSIVPQKGLHPSTRWYQFSVSNMFDNIRRFCEHPIDISVDISALDLRLELRSIVQMLHSGIKRLLDDEFDQEIRVKQVFFLAISL